MFGTITNDECILVFGINTFQDNSSWHHTLRRISSRNIWELIDTLSYNPLTLNVEFLVKKNLFILPTPDVVHLVEPDGKPTL